MINIAIPARLEYLGLLRAVVDALGQVYDGHPHRPSARVLYAWSLAIYEAGTNAILHGHDGGAWEPLRLAIDPSADRVVFELADSGKPNEHWTDEPHNSPDDEHGRGLEIIRHVMDEATYRSSPGEPNVLRLVAYLECAADRTANAANTDARPGCRSQQ